MYVFCFYHTCLTIDRQYVYDSNGPTHGEVKWFQEEPVLVEVGARCHGGDGLWLGLGDECFGCNQAKCSIDSYLFPNVYAMMQDAVSDIFSIFLYLYNIITFDTDQMLL